MLKYLIILTMFSQSASFEKISFNTNIYSLNRTIDFHAKSLGINDFINSKFMSQEFVGHENLTRCAKIILGFLNQQTTESQHVFITGYNGTGKTSLINAIGITLNPVSVFTSIDASEINFQSVGKIENLILAIRKTVVVTFYQETLNINGQVINIRIFRSHNKKNFSTGTLVLRSPKIQNSYEIGPILVKRLIEQKIRIGDFISINKVSGEIMKKKKRDYLSDEIEIEITREHSISLNELDCLNSYSNELSKFFLNKTKNNVAFIREKIDQLVLSWAKERKIKVSNGILCIDDIHFLSTNCFSFLIKILDGLLSPSLICVSNCIKNKIVGVEKFSQYGVPLDFLDRFLIINTRPLEIFQLKEIISLRCLDGNIIIENNAHKLLVKIGLECGIRYSFYMLTMSINFSKKTRVMVKFRNILKAYDLFVDYKRFKRHSKILNSKLFLDI